MKFCRESFEVGGKVVIPSSFVSKTEQGEIVGVTNIGINVTYYKDTERAQTAFYSYCYLEKQHGLNDAIPF